MEELASAWMPLFELFLTVTDEFDNRRLELLFTMIPLLLSPLLSLAVTVAPSKMADGFLLMNMPEFWLLLLSMVPVACRPAPPLAKMPPYPPHRRAVMFFIRTMELSAT
jgi:hypothetical protein